MENGKHVKVLTLCFDGDIKPYETKLFRGAVLASMDEKANLLFHNHTGETTYRYSYPLIQYKRLKGKAAIVCVDAGADVIGQFLTESDMTLRIGEREMKLNMEHVLPSNILMQVWEGEFKYHLSRWLPLNSENYKRYLETESLTGRLMILENILKGNLLSMCKGLGIYLDKELKVSILTLSEPRLIKNKGVKIMSFDAEFKCNLSIPNNIGIGKNASIGQGIIRQIKERTTEYPNSAKDYEQYKPEHI